MTGAPFYFGPEARPLFGWLHRAERPAGDLGVVICPPFGYEAVCAHRSLRHFAEALAAAGLPALRFDQDGAGDSAGDDRDPDRLAAWVGAARAAIDALRRHEGVSRVALLGLRLGALVAALAAVERNDVAALVAVAPVVSGRAYLRELRALQLAMGLSPQPGGAPAESGVQEAAGFVLTEGLREALGKVELVRLDRPPAEVLILDRDDLPVADRWRDGLMAAGARVEARRLPGYLQMVMDPHRAEPPAAMIEAAASWLRERATGSAGPAAAEEPPASARVTPAVTERAVLVDDRLFGIQSEPTATPRSGRAILLLNAGSVHHIGPNRLYTLLARRWAARGHLVLRLDGAGLGDSPRRTGEPENVVYSPRALEDVAAGVAYLRRQAGITSCHAAGLCSGAYHAFKAAVAGQRLDGVVMINPLTFFYRPGDSLDLPHKVVETTDQYLVSARSLEKWRKLLRGETDVRVVLRMVGKRARTMVLDRTRDLSRRVGLPWPGDLGVELETVARRGIKMSFVFSEGDPGASLLRHQGGSATRTLRASRRLTVTTLDGPDHTFTSLWSHPLLTASLGAVLD